MNLAQLLDTAWAAIEQSDGYKAVQIIREYDAARANGWPEPTINGIRGDEVAHAISMIAFFSKTSNPHVETRNLS